MLTWAGGGDVFRNSHWMGSEIPRRHPQSLAGRKPPTQWDFFFLVAFSIIFFANPFSWDSRAEITLLVPPILRFRYEITTHYPVFGFQSHERFIKNNDTV
jgi:hypothetical protein